MMNVGFTFSELIESFRDALKSDTDIADFCEVNFGVPLRMFIGYVEKDGHGEDDCPFLMISPQGVETGLSAGETMFTFEIDLAIVNKEFSDYDSNDIIEQRGFYQLDEFVNLVTNALEEHASRKNAIADLVSVSYDNSTFYPLHLANMSCQVKLDAVFGAKQGIT